MHLVHREVGARREVRGRQDRADLGLREHENVQNIADVYFSVVIEIRNVLQALVVVYFNVEIKVRNMLQALSSFNSKRVITTIC